MNKTRAYRPMIIDKMSEDSTYQSKSQKIYVSMARMYSNVEIPKNILETDCH